MKMHPLFSFHDLKLLISYSKLTISNNETPADLRAGRVCYVSHKKVLEMLGNVSPRVYNTRMTTKWNKYTYVCNSCDGLIEATIMETRTISTELCPACFNSMTLLSVVDATILPTTNERQQMETATPSYLETKITELEEIISRQNSALATHQNCDYWKSENGRVQSQLISLINDSYENESDASDILQGICEIIDYQPKKTINFSGTITFSGSIDVPMEDVNDFDLHYFLQDELSLDINHGDTVIDTYEVEDVREDY